jgi:hypothetical protein
VSGLSIVIPCVGGAAEFDGTLVSVLQNRPADCEVLVAHTEPYDDPYALANELRFIQADGQSLIELLNTALTEATGDVLHVVGCGLEATENWTVPALTHFDDPDVAAVSPLIVDADRQSVVSAGLRWSAGGARRIINNQRVALPGSGRLRATIDGPTLSAAFYRRDVLVALGGFDAALGAPLADVAIAVALQSLGKLHVCEPGSTLVEAIAMPPSVAGGFRSGRAAERLFWRYAHERGLALALAAHPWTIVFEALHEITSLSLWTSLLGRAAALLEIGSARRHGAELTAAAERLSDLAKLRASLRPASQRGARQPAAPYRRAA